MLGANLLVVVVVTLLLVAAVPGPTAGGAIPAETIAGIGDAASGDGAADGGTGLPSIRHVGPGEAVVTTDDDAVAGVLADLATFYAATLPQVSSSQFVPLTGGYVSVDATASSGVAPCVSVPGQLAGNAYYCPTGDAIVYDSAALVPVLLGHYGVAGLTASFAHEFGHAIQARIGPTAADRAAHPALYPSILIEAQGDCFAGAFLAWVVAGHAAHVRLGAPSLVRAVAPLLDFRDPVDVTVGDPTAHGLGLDRLVSILRGYRGGAAACHALRRAAMTPTLGRRGLLTATAPDRFVRAGAIAAARTSIASFMVRIPGADRSGSAALQPSISDQAAAAPYGQFADAAALALAIGRALTGSAWGAACFTGAWTASVFGHAAKGQLGSWAGDADEAVDMLRARPGATFDELAGYADGFTEGWSACR